MNQDERLLYLIEEFLIERPELANLQIPADTEGRRHVLRALMNTRNPIELPDEVEKEQDTYLQERIREKGITKLEDVPYVEDHIKMWRGDITTLECDAIVNAANNGMTGCWSPNHYCIDNCIHTFAGVQLRYECAELMIAQAHPEPVGNAKVTGAYNLPCKRIIHTVGPQVESFLTNSEKLQLAASYKACYRAAHKCGLSNIAFCCVSTGVFGFPNDEASKIAVDTVRELQTESKNPLDVCFVVFTDLDEELYRALLG